MRLRSARVLEFASSSVMALLGVIVPTSIAWAQIPEQSVIEEKLGPQWTKDQRDEWFNKALKGRSVKWTGKVMSATEQTNGGVLVDMLRSDPRASFECVIYAKHRNLEKYALSLAAGQQATCSGVISGYLRLYGDIRFRVEAESLVSAALR
jgi:hypothetical protein